MWSDGLANSGYHNFVYEVANVLCMLTWELVLGKLGIFCWKQQTWLGRETALPSGVIPAVWPLAAAGGEERNSLE
jgi:hypothetical protein